MTPDTAALRALVDTYVTGWYLTAAEVRALCDAADEVERLRADAERAQAHHREVTMMHMANLAAERDASRRECDGTSALAGEALERALVAEARLVEATAQIKRLATDRDASRTAHAALIADLRALHVREVAQRQTGHGDSAEGVWLCAECLTEYPCHTRALLDRHAPTTGATP